MQEGKTDGEKPVPALDSTPTPVVSPRPAEGQASDTEAQETFLSPDPKGVFVIGEVISEEGDVFLGVTSDGKALLAIPGGEPYLASLEELQDGRRTLETDEEHGTPAPEEGSHAIITELTREALEMPPLDDLQKELQTRVGDVAVAEKIIRTPELAKKRYDYAQEFIETSFDRFVEIAALLGSASTDPRELLALVERKIEAEKGESAPTSEGDSASQLTERSRRDEVIALIEEGSIQHVNEEELYRFRHETAVQNYFAKDILTKLAAGATTELDALDGHDWRFAAALLSPSLPNDELKKITGYLTERMRSDIDKPIELPERKTAKELLQEFGVKRFLYQGKGHIKNDKGGLDEAASEDNVRALKDDLLAAGMSADDVRKAISAQKNRARARNNSPKKADLEPYDLVEIRRRELSKIAESELAELGTEVTDKEMAAAAALPPVMATSEMIAVGVGGDLSPLVEDAEDVVDENSTDEKEASATASIVTPAVTQTPVQPVAAEAQSPITIPTPEEIAAFTRDTNAALQNRVVEEAKTPIPTLTEVATEKDIARLKNRTPNQRFTDQMKTLELQAELLAKKGVLLPDEKERLAALEQEMSELEKEYLAERKKRMPEVELDAQGEAMMHLINSIPVVQVNMESAAVGTAVALGTAVSVTESTPTTPAPEVPIVDAAERTPITDAVLKKFSEALGMDQGTLEKIPGFCELSPGKQLLILRNMQNEVLLDVTREADKTQKEEWKGRSVWGKLWNGVRTMGTYQTIRTKEIEKELLAAAKGTSDDFVGRAEALAGHIENIEEYVKVMEATPPVTINPETGEFNIAYATPFGGAEIPNNMEIHAEFNAVASKFASIPREWGYEPQDEKEKGQFETYQAERNNYFDARGSLISLYTQHFTKKGVADPTKEAIHELSRIEERIELDQLFNAHPNAEKALNAVESQSAVWAGIKEFAQDKGKYIAFGMAARMTATAITGALTGGIAAPFAYAIAGGVGAGVGRAQGMNEAKKIIRQRRIDRRLSEEDEREQFTYKKYAYTVNDQGQPVLTLDKDKKPVVAGEGKRGIKEFTDATFFTDRIDRLTKKLEQVSTLVHEDGSEYTEEEKTKERTLLESKIAKTTALMEQKLKRGLINFGGSSLEADDARKGNDIANKFAFMQAMGKGAAVEIIDPLELRIEMGRIIGEHQGEIESIRNKEVKNAGVKAAMIRGGFALGGAYIAGKLHETGLADDFFKRFATLKEEAAVVVGLKESFHQYSPNDIAHLRAAVLAYKDPEYPAALVEQANHAQAKALAEYMAAKDPATRHAIAETMGLTEDEINARIRHFLDIAEHSSLPREAVVPHATAGSASAPNAAASAASAPEAAASAVHGEMVPLVRANELAHEYLNADMIGHKTAEGELLAQEWRFMSGKNAESILSATKEQAVQSPGGADMWPSILHMQAYAKANGFTAADGITPKSSETLEQFFLRAHALHIMKYGVSPRAHDAVPSPSETGSPDDVPAQTMSAPQDNRTRLIGGPGAIPHERTPDGGVPQRGAIGWPESKPESSSAPAAAPRVVAPLPPPPPAPEFVRGASSAFPNGLPPPPPPPEFMTAPGASVPNAAPVLPPPPPRPEFMTAPRAATDIPPPPPRPEFMSAAPNDTVVASAPDTRSGFVKTNYVVENGTPDQMSTVVFELKRAPYLGMEKGASDLLAPTLAQARETFGAAVDRPAVEVMNELKASGSDLYRPFSEFLARGYVPHDGESAIAFYERCAREELLKVKVPAQGIHQVAGETLPHVTPEARFDRNVGRLWDKMLWTYGHHEYLTDSKGTVEDLLSGKMPVDRTDANGTGLKYWQSTIRTLIQKSGVTPEPGEHVEAYSKRAIADMLHKNPTLRREDILPNGRDIIPVPPKPTASLEQANVGAAQAPRVEAMPQSEVIPPIVRPEGAGVVVSPEAAKHTAMIADKWSEVARGGLGKNSHWGETRNYVASELSNGKLANGAPGTVEEANYQMQEMLKKTQAMGFRPKQGELSGAYLDRVAKELHIPVDEYAAAERSRNICDVIATYMPARQGLDPKLSAEDILSGKSIPTGESAKAYLHLQKIVARVRENTGVVPKKGDTIDEYIFLAVRDQLKKTPELHASTLLAPKGAVFQPIQPSQSVAPIAPPKPAIPQPPKLRWDQQA